MKKFLCIMLLLFICGCNNNENSLIKNNYINNNDYNKIYSDLLLASNNVSYIPSSETEKSFYELIEAISDNCTKFSSSELDELYNLINNNYHFTYHENRYNNDDYKNDLNIIKTCKVE